MHASVPSYRARRVPTRVYGTRYKPPPGSRVVVCSGFRIPAWELVLKPSGGLLSPSKEVARGEEGRRMWAALEGLKDRYRRVIVLRHFEGASWEMVAETLECPSTDAARMLYARATVVLKKSLEDD